MDRSKLVATCVLCLLGAVVAAPAAGVMPVATPEGGIGDVTLSGPGVLETGADSPSTTGESTLSGAPSGVTLWQSEPFRASAVLSDQPGVSRYRICAYAITNGTRSQLDCERATALDGSTTSVNVTGLAWPTNTSGTGHLAFELYAAAEPETPIDNQTLPVTVLTKGGDTDADGLTNEDEQQLGLDPLDADMDEDGLADGTEVNDYGTSPRDADTDGDGVRDGEEVQAGSDPTEADGDGDGLTDDTELTLGTDPTSSRTTERLVAGVAALLYVGASTVVLWRRRVRNDDDDGALRSHVPRATLNDALSSSGDGAEPEPAREPALLTDEDRVRHLLDRSGGRMKQSAIVEETGWSKAKVSRLLSAMDEDGAVEKLSLGRENVISLDREWIDAQTTLDPDDSDADTDTGAATGVDATAREDADSAEPEPVADGAGSARSTENDP